MLIRLLVCSCLSYLRPFITGKKKARFIWEREQYLQQDVKRALERATGIFCDDCIAVNFLWDVDEVVVLNQLSRVEITIRGREWRESGGAGALPEWRWSESWSENWECTENNNRKVDWDNHIRCGMVKHFLAFRCKKALPSKHIYAVLATGFYEFY